eukprot:1131113_1
MPQNEYIEEHTKRYGRRYDHEIRKRKREAREHHTRSQQAQKMRGIKAKLHNKARYSEKAEMKKTLAMHDERTNKHKNEDVRRRARSRPICSIVRASPGQRF